MEICHVEFLDLLEDVVKLVIMDLQWFMLL